MNKNSIKKAGAMMMAAAFALTPAAGVMAAPEDIIDTSKKGSITLHKYDMTAAQEDGVDLDQWESNGEQNAEAEAALERYEIEGVEFTYAKVADINTVTENGEIKVLYNLPSGLADVLQLEDTRGDGLYNSTEINTALENLLTDNTAGKNALENYIEGVSNRTTMMSDENGLANADNLELGLYFFVETKVPANVNTTIDPFFVSVPMTNDDGEQWFYDVYVYPKNQTNIPDLDKKVRQHDDAELYDEPEYKDSATGSEGDVMDYIFVSHLPKITSEATYLTQYTFVDQLDKGLSYNRDAAIYFYDNRDDAMANNTENAIVTWKHGATQFSENYASQSAEYNQLTIAPTLGGLAEINPELSDCYLVVAYTATVNSDATPILGDHGNTNNVELTWKRTSMEYSDTLEDRARVYTYALDLTKQFTESDQEFDFTKVQFVLQNKTDGHYITAKQASAGKYYVTDATKGATEGEGTVFVPDTNGKLIIEGLEANTYVLTEIHTSDGYSLLKEPITFDIQQTEDTFIPSRTTLYDTSDIEANPNKTVIEQNGDRASATVDGNEVAMTVHDVKNIQSTNAYVPVTVINTPSFELPMTGGTGTLIVTLAGAAVVVAGVIVLTRKSNKSAA